MFLLVLQGDAVQLSKNIQTVLVDASIEIDYSCRFEPDGNSLTVLVARDDQEETNSLLQQFARVHQGTIESITPVSRVAQVAVVGQVDDGHHIQQNIAAILAEKEITIYQLKTSKRAVGILMPADRMEDAVKALHNVYMLQQPPIKKVA